MLFLLMLAARIAITFTIALFGYILSRRFVENRLRYVDAVQSPLAALIAGVAATVVFLPLTFLPLIGVGTAIFLGVGVFAGVASGAREIRRRIGAG